MKIHLFSMIAVIFLSSCTISGSINSPTTTVIQITTTITPTSDSSIEARKAAETYYNYLKDGDYESAVDMFSTFSLEQYNISKNEILNYIKELDFKGWKFLDYLILDPIKVNEKTIIFDVTTKEMNNEKEQYYDGKLVLYLEENWKISYSNLISSKDIIVDKQTIEGVDIKPYKILITAVELRILLSIKNTNSSKIYWGWAGETIAKIHFSDGNEKVINSNMVINPKANLPDAYIAFEGYYIEYPTKLFLLCFMHSLQKSDSLPDRQRGIWEYEFNIN